MKETLEILKTVTEAPGVSGYESPIREILKDLLIPFSSEHTVDNLGSLIVTKEGKSTDPKIMIAAHMDEVGFMVTRITEEGFIKFQQLGGWWEQVLPSQRVEILTQNKKVIGIIGAKAPHIMSQEERKQPIKMNALYIDVGSASKKETEELGIKAGDPIVPWSPFIVSSNGKTIMAKALDDRAGCAMVVEIFQRLTDISHQNTVFGAMTVQEEVGLRGAITSVNVVKPDLAIIVDVAVSTDTPGIDDNEVAAKTYLGKGPVIGFYDASMIPHIPLRNLVVRTAEENNIPYQVEVMAGGGTDAGKIHVYRQGVPSIVIGIPVRYIHDHVGIAHLDDYRNAVDLILLLIKVINTEVFTKLRIR